MLFKRRIFLVVCFLFIVDSFSWGKILTKLEIDGLSVISRSSVRSTIGINEGDYFTSTDVSSAVKRLYKQGNFKDIRVSLKEETDSSAVLHFSFVENPICELVEFSGNKKIKTRTLQDSVSIKKGYVVSDATLFKAVSNLKRMYSNKGYLLADISCDIIETKTPGNVIVKFSIKEGRKVRIKDIKFNGNSVFTTKKLKRKFKTKEKRWFNNGEFKKDEYEANLDSLMAFYHNRGYLNAEIKRDTVIYDDNKKDIHILIDIYEGHKFYVGDFYFEGNKILSSDMLRQSVALKKGSVFALNKFGMTKGLIGNAYREEGYLWAQVMDSRNYRGDTIDITFNITEGRAAIVRKIDITGNEKTRDKVIRRELSIYPGQKYKQSRMERSVRDAMQLKYFDNVLPDLRPNEDGTIDLTYNVKETENIGQFSAGVQYSEQGGFGANFSITIPNFRGAGEQLSSSIEYGAYRQVFSVSFSEPWVFNTPTYFSARMFYQRDNSSSYDYQSYGFEPGISRKLKWPDDYFTAHMSYRISYEKDYRTYIEDIPNLSIITEGFLSKLTLALVRNSTDIPNFPNRGSIFSLENQFAGLGGDFSFIKTTLSYDWYFPLFWKNVLGLKTKFGLIGGLKDEKIIAREDLFAAGGVYYDGTLRGYDEGEFGKYNNRGLALLNFSGEFRIPILEQQLYLALFLDAGNVWDSMADIDLADMYAGTGFGTRLMIPMLGLLGFDFGWKLVDPNMRHFEDVGSFKRFNFHFLMNRGF